MLDDRARDRDLDDDFDDGDDDAIEADQFIGLDKARSIVRKFLESLTENPDNEGVLPITVWHVTNRGRDEKDVWSVRHRIGAPLDDMIDDMMEAVCEHCDTIRGRNRYRLTVRTRDGSKCFTVECPPLRRDEHPLTMRDFDTGGDQQSGYAQTLRHNEAVIKMMLQVVDRSLTDSQNEKDELRREARDLRREREASIEREERVRSMQFARDMEVRKVQKADQRKEMMIDHGAQIVKRFMEGKGYLPPAPPPIIGENAPIQARLMKFVSSLTPEQFNPEALSPEQKAMLQSLIMEVAAWQSSAAEKARSNTPSSQKADEAPSEGHGSQPAASPSGP